MSVTNVNVRCGNIEISKFNTCDMKITPRQPISVKISSHTGICTHKPQSAHTLQRKLGLCSRTLRLSTSLARSAPLSFITAVRWPSAIQRFVKNEYKSQEKSKSPTQTLSVLTAGLARYFAANKTSAAPLMAIRFRGPAARSWARGLSWV